MATTREQPREAGLLVPNARIYDWVTSALLSGLYRGIARDVAGARPESVLEVGAGTGALARRLVARGLTVTVTDLDPAMANRARRRLPDSAEVVVADVAALPFPDASFDLVLATLTVHHWPDVPAAAAEVSRVLRPGGQALVWDLAKDPSGVHAQGRLAHIKLVAPELQAVSDESWPWPLRLRLMRRMSYRRT